MVITKQIARKVIKRYLDPIFNEHGFTYESDQIGMIWKRQIDCHKYIGYTIEFNKYPITETLGGQFSICYYVSDEPGIFTVKSLGWHYTPSLRLKKPAQLKQGLKTLSFFERILEKFEGKEWLSFYTESDLEYLFDRIIPDSLAQFEAFVRRSIPEYRLED